MKNSKKFIILLTIFFLICGLLGWRIIILNINIKNLETETENLKRQVVDNNIEISHAFNDIGQIRYYDLNVLFNMDLNEFGFKYHNMQAESNFEPTWYYQEYILKKNTK